MVSFAPIKLKINIKKEFAFLVLNWFDCPLLNVYRLGPSSQEVAEDCLAVGQVLASSHRAYVAYLKRGKL